MIFLFDLSHFSIYLVGIFGEVLFWTLRTVLGSEDYDLIMHTAWLKFYSRILDGIVPIVLTHEISQSHVAKEFNAVVSMPIMASVDMAKKGLIDEEATKTFNESSYFP